MSNGIGISTRSEVASAMAGRDDTAQALVNQINMITSQLCDIEERLADTSRILYGPRPLPVEEKLEASRSPGMVADMYEGLSATRRTIDRIDSDLNYLRNRLGIN